ncbi:hypothetical protein A2803_01050 [Candidatus Woesebacteria bacterium RIFCSPHIGHO2_01_FULL_44_21]|uniref:Uncharacterized protein n=1 Tax=Candidatus Woesebacteria bacterium RIFCSPHIGHO2_01_FULL_44_21 TaxID=1802503 RepID=A0A1F7YZF4_9BACT|nr:MAG: hypothetical protein A2803_01050 [Candidatus Woesebacteria bacterium RIFCSPHIGHO2_01_FULL_44_21]OGM69721.1 MAG: hypothetical protein A2897_00240 [Candidatus Woesebacteria bacterium RIFCSPLOWO2_01_FULL_44_24b]
MNKEMILDRSAEIMVLLEEMGVFTPEEIASMSIFKALSESVGGSVELFSGNFPDEQRLGEQIIQGEEFETAQRKVLGDS